MRGRDHWSSVIEDLDPLSDYREINRILSQHEFPWDINQALSFALFRTYAVPSIGRLLFRTGELTERTQKRYDDTVVLLEHVLEHGTSSAEGRSAVRRINQMHGRFDISAEDMRYVLSTFVVMPVRWLAEYGWRPMTEHEQVACAEYYKELGRHMGITELPATYQEFESLLDSYEAAYFSYDPQARQVADATLELLGTFPPNNLAPRRVVRRFAYALMDEPVLDAFRYPHPSRVERAVARGALRSRGRLLRWAPPRVEPQHLRDLPGVRSYPDGYRVEELGTFPPSS